MTAGADSYLGVDVGGTKVGLRFETGERAGTGEVFEARATWPRDGGVDADLAVLAELVEQAGGTWGQPLRAVGVAMPGTIAPDGTLLAWPGRRSWVGLDLGAALRTIFPAVPVHWADDGDLGALAEARHAGCDDLVYLGVGTGVGGGIVINGQVLPGFARGSCELGHLVVDLDGPECDCGRAGCVQSFAGGPAILRRAAALRGAATTPEQLRAGWHTEEAWAVEALETAAAVLATAVINVGEMLHPDLALIGGGFAAAHEGFVTRIGDHVHRLSRPGQTSIPVRPAALGGLSSLRGAVELARSAAS
jgi:kanosamine 6-kinase